MARPGLTPEELKQLDTHLRQLVEAQDFAERLHSTGVVDLTDVMAEVGGTIEALQRIKSEFGPRTSREGD